MWALLTSWSSWRSLFFAYSCYENVDFLKFWETDSFDTWLDCLQKYLCFWHHDLQDHSISNWFNILAVWGNVFVMISHHKCRRDLYHLEILLGNKVKCILFNDHRKVIRMSLINFQKNFSVQCVSHYGAVALKCGNKLQESLFQEIFFLKKKN